MALLSRCLPSLLRVPVSPVPRSQRYYEGATTSHPRINGHLFVSLPPPTRPSFFVSRRSAPGRVEASSKPGPCCCRLPCSGYSHVDANGISQVFRRSFLCLCSVPGPRSNRRTLATDGHAGAAPAIQTAKASALADFGANPQLWHALPYASCVVLPPHMQGLLPAGGLRLCREGFEPSASLRKVSVRWFDDHPPFLLS